MSAIWLDDDPSEDFPSVIATNQQSGSLGAVVFTDTPVAGDLLLVVISVYWNASRTVTPPAGWSTLYNELGDGELRRACAFWKISDGAEASPTFTLNTSATVAGVMRRYRGAAHGQPISQRRPRATEARSPPP